MDLTVYVDKIVMTFSRPHKYTLGSELRGKSWKIVEPQTTGCETLWSAALYTHLKKLH